MWAFWLISLGNPSRLTSAGSCGFHAMDQPHSLPTGTEEDGSGAPGALEMGRRDPGPCHLGQKLPFQVSSPAGMTFLLLPPQAPADHGSPLPPPQTTLTPGPRHG